MVVVGVVVGLEGGGGGARKEEMAAVAAEADEEEEEDEEGRAIARLAKGEGVEEGGGRARVWVGRP
jgi:hypothetical protein